MNKWLGMAVAMLIAGSAFAQPGMEDYTKAQDAMKTNDLKAVVAPCEAALAASADYTNCWLWLGYAYRASQDWPKTATNLTEFLKKIEGQDNVDELRRSATRDAGIALARSSQLTPSIRLLDQSVAAKPNDVEAQFWLGMALRANKQEDRSEQVFGKVIQLSPEIARPYYYAGRVNYSRGDTAKAQTRLTKYLELEPEGAFAPEAHFMLGSSMYRSLDKVEDQASQFPAIKNHMSTLLSAKPKAPQASEAHYVLGWIAAQEEDNETAKSHFEIFIQLQPNGPQSEEAKKFLAALAESAG